MKNAKRKPDLEKSDRPEKKSRPDKVFKIAYVMTFTNEKEVEVVTFSTSNELIFYTVANVLTSAIKELAHPGAVPVILGGMTMSSSRFGSVDYASWFGFDSQRHPLQLYGINMTILYLRQLTSVWEWKCEDKLDPSIFEVVYLLPCTRVINK